MIQRKISLFALGTAFFLVTCLYARETSSNVIPYPEGFRKWVHVKTALIGPQSPAFSGSGGFHHIYANAKAMEGFEGGKFSDGAVFVFELLEAKEANGVNAEGARQRIDVMVKDARRYSSSGGWGYERFLGDNDKSRPLTDKTRAECFRCHEQMKAHDFVFSQFRK